MMRGHLMRLLLMQVSQLFVTLNVSKSSILLEVEQIMSSTDSTVR
jgi:hypothetical protein